VESDFHGLRPIQKNQQMNNTVSIPAGELKPALAGLAKVIDPRSPVEALRCVRVEAGGTGIQLLGSDSKTFVRVTLGEGKAGIGHPIHIPLCKLQQLVRRVPQHALLQLREGLIQCDLGTGRVEEPFEPVDPSRFPEEPDIEEMPVGLPEAFVERFREALSCASTEQSRPILNGVLLDASERLSHCLVATDGRHLFTAKSPSLPVTRSIVVPALRILGWKGLGDEWAISLGEQNHPLRIQAGNWWITTNEPDGIYPDWREVVPKEAKAILTIPDNRSALEVLEGFPEAADRDKGILLVHERGVVSLRDASGNSSASFPGATATGPDITICLNRDYLAKALELGLTTIGLTTPSDALHFKGEERQMVVMPIRFANQPQEETPNHPTEHKTNTNMTAPQTNGVIPPRINGTHPVPANGGARNSGSSTNSKPSIEAAIDNLDSFRASLREALNGISEITSLLRQAIRDQRANEREIQSVRQTLRSLQGVRI
jgi:DNA polymerase III sliding clamp (beta) subunit (PCNA family)